MKKSKIEKELVRTSLETQVDYETKTVYFVVNELIMVTDDAANHVEMVTEKRFSEFLTFAQVTAKGGIGKISHDLMEEYVEGEAEGIW